MPGSRRHQRDPWLLGQSPPSVGHVHGRRLVPGMNQRDVPSDCGVIDRENLIA